MFKLNDLNSLNRFKSSNMKPISVPINFIQFYINRSNMIYFKCWNIPYNAATNQIAHIHYWKMSGETAKWNSIFYTFSISSHEWVNMWLFSISGDISLEINNLFYYALPQSNKIFAVLRWWNYSHVWCLERLSLGIFGPICVNIECFFCWLSWGIQRMEYQFHVHIFEQQKLPSLK